MTTMDSIAATAGVSKPLVYRHFHNRHEALVEVVDRESERLMEVLGIDARRDATPDFELLTTTFLRFAADSPASFRLLFQLVDAAAGAAKRRVDQLRDRVGRVMVSSLLAEVDAANRPDMTPPSGDAAWLAGMVSSIVEGVASGLARGEDPARRALALRQLLQPEGVLAALVEFRSRRDPVTSVAQERS
jgi:AcrR family transcriptional regulator